MAGATSLGVLEATFLGALEVVAIFKLAVAGETAAAALQVAGVEGVVECNCLSAISSKALALV